MDNNSRKGIKDKKHLKNLDMEKLQELIDSGKEYNYSKFCPMLGLEKLNSHSKESQLKALEIICEYEKVGTKYKFLRLREDDEIVLYDDRAKYLPFIGTFMYQLFMEKEKAGECVNGLYYITTPQALQELGMVNRNYTYLHNHKNKWEYRDIAYRNHKEDFNKYEINSFMDITYRQILRPIIRDSFRLIDNQYGVAVQRAYKCYCIVGENRIYSNHLVTSKIGQQITWIARDALEEIGVDSMDKLYVMKASTIRKYYDLCNKLCKERLNYDGFCQCYAISAKPNSVGAVYNWNKEAIRRELNKRIVERIKTAKSLGKLRGDSKDNLINAVIYLQASYDFEKEYKLIMEDE